MAVGQALQGQFLALPVKEARALMARDDGADRRDGQTYCPACGDQRIAVCRRYRAQHLVIVAPGKQRLNANGFAGDQARPQRVTGAGSPR